MEIFKWKYILMVILILKIFGFFILVIKIFKNFILYNVLCKSERYSLVLLVFGGLFY